MFSLICGIRIPDSGSGFRFRIIALGLPSEKRTVGREGLQSVFFVVVTNVVGPFGSVAKNYTLYRGSRILLMKNATLFLPSLK